MQQRVRRRAGLFGVALIIGALMTGFTGATASAASVNAYEDHLEIYNPCTGSWVEADGTTRAAFKVLGSTGFAVGSVSFVGEGYDFVDDYDVTLRGSTFSLLETEDGETLYFTARGSADGSYGDTSFTFWADVYVYESDGMAWADISTYDSRCTSGGDSGGEVPL